MLSTMRHLGILAHSTEGAALCFRAFCQEGFAELAPNEHPDVSLDCIALARSMPAWEARDYPSIRAILALSVQRLAAAGADFFVCPDNTAHIALEQPGSELALAGLHIAEVVADQAARDGRRRVGVLGTKYLMEAPLYPRVLAEHDIVVELPGMTTADHERDHLRGTRQRRIHRKLAKRVLTNYRAIRRPGM